MSRPTAGPMTCGSEPEKARSQPSSPDNSRATDSRSSRSLYLTADRLYAIQQELTDRDWQVLAFVCGVRLATGKQLVRHFWPGEDRGKEGRAGRKALKRLGDWRVLDVMPPRIGRRRAGSDSLVYAVGPAGIRLLARRGYEGKRLEPPGAFYTAHTLNLAEIVVSLHERDLAGELEVLEIQSEPQCWRGYLGVMGARRMLRPDLYLRLGAGAYEDRYFIEADLGTESGSTITTKGKRYLAYYQSGAEQAEHGVFPHVLFAVPDDRRAEQVETALGRLPKEAERLFGVCRLDQLPDHLIAEARR